MNLLNILGITDIVLILFFSFCVIYFTKKGFLKKFLELAKGFFGIIVSLILAIPFNNYIVSNHRNLYLDTISERLALNISSKLAEDPKILESGNVGVAIMQKMGFPSFFAKMLPGLDKLTTENVANNLAELITNRVLGVIIAFLILFFGTTILCFILRIMVHYMRKVKVFKWLDSVLGCIFGIISFLLITSIYMLLLSLCLNSFPAINQLIRPFLEVDMQLSTNSFRLSKYFYENNILGNFFGLFL